MDFRQFLEMKFLEWQKESGGRKTVSEFAAYLGVSQQSVSNWWNNLRIPQGENVDKIAKKLGIEVYDILGIDRPDPDLYFIEKAWEFLSPQQRRQQHPIQDLGQ